MSPLQHRRCDPVNRAHGTARQAAIDARSRRDRAELSAYPPAAAQCLDMGGRAQALGREILNPLYGSRIREGRFMTFGYTQSRSSGARVACCGPSEHLPLYPLSYAATRRLRIHLENLRITRPYGSGGSTDQRTQTGTRELSSSRIGRRVAPCASGSLPLGPLIPSAEALRCTSHKVDGGGETSGRGYEAA